MEKAKSGRILNPKHTPEISEDLDTRLKNIEMMLRMLLKQEANPAIKDEVNMEEAAELCGLSLKTMYTYLNNGKLNIPYVKRGTKTFLWRADVIRWNTDRQYKVIHRNGEKQKVSM